MAGSRPGRPRYGSLEGNWHESNSGAPRSRTEHLARQHHARPAVERHAAHYIDEFSVTGLTSNPTIFDHAIKNSTAYDAASVQKLRRGHRGRALFFELALEDLGRAADLFRPVYERTDGVDGWVSLEVSPVLAYDSGDTLAAAKDLHARAARPNLFIKIPGTRKGYRRSRSRFSPASRST